MKRKAKEVLADLLSSFPSLANSSEDRRIGKQAFKCEIVVSTPRILYVRKVCYVSFSFFWSVIRPLSLPNARFGVTVKGGVTCESGEQERRTNSL